jgi:hypothetical protein
MIFRFQYLLLVTIFLFPAFCVAAVIKGKITDKNGEPLPFATVYIQGTTIGTAANASGDYQLVLEPGSYTVVCQYISFSQSSLKITITGNETLEHNFRLEDQSLKMKEFVVKSSEDPATYIMRKVIGKREHHLKQVKTFETGIYLKGVFKTRQTPKKVLGQKVEAEELGLDSSGKGILYLCEEVATYYAEGEKQRTVIHSVRESGSPNGLGFSQFPPVISFYQNNIKISDRMTPRGLISPVNDLALAYYSFKLEGDFKEGEHTIYKIRVTPKRAFEPLFEGFIYIVDEEWAIHSLNLKATKRSNIDVLDTLRIEQVYLPLTQDTWIIKQQVLYATLKIFGFDLGGYFATVYNGQKVNQSMPDTIFKDKLVSVYDRTANKKDTSWWTNVRPVPLEGEESNDYLVKDSLRIRFEDPRYIDSMRRRRNRLKPTALLLTGYSFTGRKEVFSLRTNALLTGLLNYNTIEGVNVAPRLFGNYNVDSTHSVSGTVAARYGFENQHFNAIGRVMYNVRSKDWIGRQWSVGVEAGKYVFQLNPNNPIGALYNTISTLFYRKNYLKLYERWNGTLLFSKNYGTGMKWNASIGFQQRLPLENSTDFTFAKEAVGGFTDNIPSIYKGDVWEKHNAVIAKLSVSYQPGITYTRYPDYIMPHRSELPTFTLGYQKGIPNILESKTDFDKWRFGIRDDIGLRMLGDLSYNVSTGGFLNTNYVSIPDLNHLNGNQLTLASPYLESFQLAPYYQLSNKEDIYGEAHLEWYLRGFLTNKVPLLRQLRWYLVAGTNAYYANDNLYQLEAYVGIDNFGYDKFRMLRVDFVHGWNSLNQQMWAIKIGISKSSIISLNLGDTSGEW